MIKIKNNVKLLIFIINILFVLNFVLNCEALADDIIKKILIENNNRIENSTIENYLGFTVGDIYNESNHNKMLKSLYATNLFSDINVSFQKQSKTLLVRVNENQFISKITFIGNKKIRSSDLSKEIITNVGDTLSDSYLKLDIEKI